MALVVIAVMAAMFVGGVAWMFAPLIGAGRASIAGFIAWVVILAALFWKSR